MIRKLWKRFDTAMIGYWLPTILTIMSLAVVFGCGYFVDRVFYWFGISFGPLIVLMWASIWRLEHPIVKYGRNNIPPDRIMWRE